MIGNVCLSVNPFNYKESFISIKENIFYYLVAKHELKRYIFYLFIMLHSVIGFINIYIITYTYRFYFTFFAQYLTAAQTLKSTSYLDYINPKISTVISKTSALSQLQILNKEKNSIKGFYRHVSSLINNAKSNCIWLVLTFNLMGSFIALLVLHGALMYI